MVAAICFTLPNFLYRGVDKHLCHTWRMYRLINILPSWGISLCLSWVDEYYWDFQPITTIHSYTFLLWGSIERAWLDDLTLLNWFLAARTLCLAGFLVYGSPVCRALGSGFIWISEYLALVVPVGMWGMSGEVLQAMRSLWEGETLPVK